MIVDKSISFGLYEPPIDAQYALDVIFKILVDDKGKYEYLTTMSESTDQINAIKLDLILSKYSHKYRRYKKARINRERR